MRRTGCRWSGHVYEQAAKAALPFCRRDCLRISALRRSVSARVKKESYRILTGWFFIMAMVICRQSLYRPPVFHFSPTKDFALLLMGMLNLLYFLIVLFGTVYWLPGISYSEARDAGMGACRRVWRIPASLRMPGDDGLFSFLSGRSQLPAFEF